MTELPNLTPEKPKRFRRLGAIAGAGLVAGMLAVAIGGVASAQSVEITELNQPAATVQLAAQTDNDGDTQEGPAEDGDTGFGLSAEDEAIFEQYDQCLQDAGLNFEEDESPQAHLDEAAFDAAFETCDPILDNLSADYDADAFELTPEDEAVFERFEQCLSDAGVDLENEADVDDATFDAAFDTCDPILEELSEALSAEFDDEFGDLSAEDEAVFEQYDKCLTDAGLSEDTFDGDDVDEDAIEQIFEGCESVLDGLSEEAQELFGDCPEDDEHDGEDGDV